VASAPLLSNGVVGLGTFDEDDVPLLHATYSDIDYQLNASPTPLLPRPTAFFRSRVREGHLAPLTSAANAIELCILDLASDPTSVGVVGLYGIDRVNGNAELGVTVGLPSARRRGFGRGAAELMIDWGFRRFGLSRVYAHVKEGNVEGRRMCEQIGFVPEGVLRAHRLRAGRPIDLLVVGLLATEWAPPDAPTV
jgi:RimJ/RimL family protein N-acetyltransferase